MSCNGKRLLPAALLLALLVSCGDAAVAEDGTSADTASQTETPTETETASGYPAPDFTGLDFGGQELRFATPNCAEFADYFPEEMTGETVDDAAFTRLSNVQNTLNVTITNLYDEIGATIQDTVKQSVLAGDDAFDIVFTHCIYGIGDYVTGNMLYNLDELPHLDLGNPWWNQEVNDSFRIGSETYYAFGDIILLNPDVVYFNKTISEEYDLPNHYDRVKAGTWTYDVFLNEIKSVSVDLNGDGVMDDADKVGISGDMTEMLSALPFACGIRMTKATEDGLVLDFWSDKIVDVYEETYDVFMDKSVSQIYFRLFQDVAQNFSDGRSLFSINNTGEMVKLRDYDVEFGVLPMPKYDEKQEEYQCLIWTMFCCVPTTVQRPELVGACLEQFAYESTAVKTAYTEVLIRGKSTRDVESLEMLDIIYDSQVSDIGLNYLGFDPQFHKIFYCFYELMGANNKNITSHYEKAQKSVQKVLDNLYDKIIENQEMN